MRTLFKAGIILLVFAAFAGGCAGAFSLKDYVATPDDAYTWRVIREQDIPGRGRVYFLEFTSQKWQDMTWSHRLNVIVPANLRRCGAALLFITGSGSGDEELMYMAQLGRIIGLPIAILHDIPNQPLFGGLREDEIIAYTFKKFLETGDETWPLLVPMTAAAVRAMDTMQIFGRTKVALQIDRFIVSGASKRGWTTWLTAAVDDRVTGIVPIVYDNLNLREQMKHQLEVWGAYSEQIADYTRYQLPDLLLAGGEKAEKLTAIVDPYAYIDKITIPKLIVIGTNDRYWPIDALNIYYDDLAGDTYILYVPNVGHGLGDVGPVIRAVAAFALGLTGVI